MELLFALAFYWQLFIFTPMLPFACAYLLAISMPGWRSLAAVGLLAAALSIGFLVDWWQDQPTYYYLMVREAYKWHLAILPTMLGLVGGTALRAYQLHQQHPRIGWISAGLFFAGLSIRVDPAYELFRGG